MRRILLYISALASLGLAIAQQAGTPRALPVLPESDPADSVGSNRFVPIESDSIFAVPDSLSIMGDSIFVNDSTIANDSSYRARRSSAIPQDSSRSTLSRINRNKVDLDNTVQFDASDSLVMIGQNNAYLFGDSKVEYGQFKLNAQEIKMNLENSTVYATGAVDSTGNLTGTPIFSDGGDEYESKEMTYNFKTERGFITNVITEQGEGYLTSEASKKMEDGSFFVENGKYTTCDDHEHPHFYFNVTKGKMVPRKNIVTGPVYMVLADVPLPLALPFGFFPFTKDYSSGVIVPTFGEDYNRGFYLRDGGYYFAINDNVDLALRGEIYTKGSWGITGHSSYVKRYRFRGNFDISYITTIYGDKGSPDYSKQNNFQVIWSHSQDTKANPNMNFSASVNFTTSGYTRNDLNSYYNSSFTENTKSSTVNMTYRFPGTKWSLSTTANISQRTQDSTLSVSFPNVNVSLSQTAPFKRKKSVGGEKWYEKIKLSYTGQFQNSLTARQDQFFQKSLIKDWRNGLKHYVPVSATFSLFKYINISPSITMNDRMYASKIRRQWDTQASREVMDTTYGFYNLFDFNASLAFDTKIYGFWKPMKFLGDKVQMIRHVLTPTVSFNASPDFSDPMWGIYGTYDYVDAQGVTQFRKYNYFSHGLMGSPSAGKTGAISVSLANNLEMKVKSDKDSTGVKKISLIENFSISQSYNFAADSMNWSNINTSILLRLIKNFNLNLSATWDPYTYRLNSSGSPVKVNVPRWKAGKGWARLSSTGTSFSYTFNNQTFKRKKNENTNNSNTTGNGEGDNEPFGNGDGSEANNFDSFGDLKSRRRKEAREEAAAADADGYAAWECPWNLTFNYSVNYGYGAFDYDKLEYKGKWTQNLSFSGSIRPTTNWNFSFSASYNFDLHKIAYMNCSLSRDLHCFTMSASFVPLGPYKSFNFNIAVKSSLLKDLKYDKRSSNTNGIDWY